MLIVPLRDRLSPDQWAAWNGIMRAALDLVRDGDPADPWLFHGTTAIQAGWVLRDGFSPSQLTGSAGMGFPSAEGVHWGHPSVASSFAGKWADSDNPPLLFAARASSVAASTPDGILRPDVFACSDCGCPRSYPDGLDHGHPDVPDYVLGAAGSLDGLEETEAGGLDVRDWQQSLACSGALTAPGGRHVPYLIMMAIPPDLPCHPDAAGRRSGRLAAKPPEWQRRYGAFVPPGMEASLDPRDADGARDVMTADDAMVRVFSPSP